jgi:hypothetical protein
MTSQQHDSVSFPIAIDVFVEQGLPLLHISILLAAVVIHYMAAQCPEKNGNLSVYEPKPPMQDRHMWLPSESLVIPVQLRAF